jgi:hypothetical protein
MYAAAIGSGELAGEHLGNCRECQENSDWLRQLLELGSKESQFEPPEWATVNAFKAFRLQKPSIAAFAKEVMTLVYDSFTEMSPVGVRQGEVPARQTLYRSEGLQLDLRVQLTGDDKGLIIGQLVSESEDAAVDGCEIALSHGGELIGALRSNSWGEFMFEDLPEGDYGLQVQFGEKMLRLPNVPLGKQ